MNVKKKFYFGRKVSIYTSGKILLQQNRPMARFGICFTYNNPEPETFIKARGAVGHAGIKYICWGNEVGADGTPHMQGYIQGNQDKYNRLMKVIGKCHMEKQKGNSTQAVDYCKKDGDFVEYGDYEYIASPKERQGQRTDLKEVMGAIEKGASELEIFREHAQTMAQYPKFIERYRQLVQEDAAMTQSRLELESWSLWKWQDALVNTVEKEVHPRQILWIWSKEGNMGKSGMAQWLMVMKDACILEPSKKLDMTHVFAQNPKGIVIFDCTRKTEEGAIGPAYSMAEQLKNGNLFSGKYNSRVVVFKKPHVIFFANFAPDRTVWSEDRYNVTELDQTSL